MLNKSIAPYAKLAVEIGSGDGKMLRRLAAAYTDTFFVGIEINSLECASARSMPLPENVIILEAAFEKFIPSVDNSSIDSVIAVLPDPSLIEPMMQEKWEPFYRELFLKLKSRGTFRLITELTNDLFGPVTDDDFSKWIEWLKSVFSSFGFSVQDCFEGAPKDYSSRCLDQFKGDPQRIRIATLDLFKP